jgi:hypothetical protein
VEQDGIDDFCGVVHKPKGRGTRGSANRIGDERASAMINERIEDTDEMK